MSTMGTFDAFTTARLGIYAAQQGFMVTGNNISNINTVGYTRQRLDQVSFKAGAYDRYRSQLENHVGSGALVMNINQIRDPYLDVRYRNTAADVGFNDTWLDGLQQIASILDEVGVGDDTNVNKKGDGRLQAQIQAVSDALRKFAKEPTSQNNDLVREAASTLCSIFNSYATKLENLRKETEKDFTDKLKEINECLTNIRDLNDEIRDNEIFGDNALELRDERNRQIDKLSELIHIKVIYSEEDIGNGRTVEKLSIYLDNDNPEPTVRTDESLLIDGVYGAQLSSPETLPVKNPYYDSTAEAYHQPESFLYLTDEQLTDEDGKLAYMDNNDEIVYLDANDPVPDGYTAVMKGTNIPEKAQQVENDYYTVMISKLYDEHGEEWVGRTTEWTQVGTAQEAAKAQYTIPITASTGWSAGAKFDVVGKTYTIADPDNGVTGDITLDDMQDPEKLAAFLAPKLNAATADYVITADGENLVYTAKKAGAIGENGPAAAPTTPEYDSNGANAAISFGAIIEVQEGLESLPDMTSTETDENGNPITINPGTTTLADGSQTITSYRQKVDGTWWRVTTDVKATRDVILDDNDLYGSLQATREMLTEAGEFTTKDILENVDENAAIKRGIPYYQLSLDLMARKFAEEYNRLNQGQAVDQNGNPITGPITETLPIYVKNDDGTISMLTQATTDDPVTYTVQTGWTLKGDYLLDTNGHYVPLDGDTSNISQIPTDTDDPDDILNALENSGFIDAAKAAEIRALPDDEKEAAVKEQLDACLVAHAATLKETKEVTYTGPTELGGPLFSNRGDLDDTEGITASNISVSQSWSNGSVELVPKFEVLWDGSLDHSTQNTNADHMVTLIDTATNLLFNPRDLVPDAISDNLFTGSFNGMYNDICTTLGEDQKATTIALNMHYAQLIEIDTNRDGVSGVDLNDEAMNLMQYQKAYSAACRLMTVIDEALDRLINNTAM